jgi:hypothetical protein
MNNWCICWFSCIFLLGILIFKGLTARRLYKSFGVKGLIIHSPHLVQRLRMSGAVPLSTLCAFVASTGKTWPFTLDNSMSTSRIPRIRLQMAVNLIMQEKGYKIIWLVYRYTQDTHKTVLVSGRQWEISRLCNRVRKRDRLLRNMKSMHIWKQQSFRLRSY